MPSYEQNLSACVNSWHNTPVQGLAWEFIACIANKPIPRKTADGAIELQSISAIWTIAKSYWLGDQKWQARGLLSLVVLFCWRIPG